MIVKLRDGVRKFICQPALNLLPEDIGLIIGFSAHEPQIAVGNGSVAMVNKALFRPGRNHRCP